MDREDCKKILEEIPDFIYYHDLEGRFVEVNSALKNLVGFEKHEVIGKKIEEFIHPRYHQEFMENYLPRVLSEEVAQGIVVVRDRKGTSHLLEFNSRLVRKDGHPVGVQGMARDVSTQKRLEREIQDREQLYRTLFENATDGIFLMEGELFIDCNPKALEMFGCDKSDLLRRSPYLFSPEYQPDGRLSRDASLEKIHKALEGVPQRFEWVHTRLDGTPFDTIVSLFRIEVQKKRLIVALLHDISPLKEIMRALEESERKYRELVENANAIICRFSTDGTFTFVNRYGAEFFGYTYEELVGKKNIVGTIIPETGGDSKRLKAMFQDICTHPEYYFENENKNITKDGREVHIAWRNQPIRDDQGNVKEILSIGADITRVRELERELLQAKKLEAVGTLAGGIAHDFNNILGGIMGYISLLKKQHAPTDLHYDVLVKLEEASLRASDLIKQLLAFSRQGKYEAKDVDVNQKIRNVIGILTYSTSKKITFDLDLDDDLPALIGDPSQIEQVIMNTCLNGIQAMPEGGTLRIETALVLPRDIPEMVIDGEMADAYVRISISDSGMGMDSHTKDHIFEPFFTTRSLGDGTGLGLSVVYGIIKNHKGGVFVESEIGQGTTFHFYFPTMGRVAEKKKKGTEKKPGDKKGLILVVDDEEIFREMLRDVLHYLGYNVLLASNGREGIEVFKSHQDDIDLVILDMNMPVMDGREMFRELKELSPDVKALLSTGFTLEGQVQELMDEGVTGFIQKPFRMEEIDAAIRDLLSLTS